MYKKRSWALTDWNAKTENFPENVLFWADTIRRMNFSRFLLKG
jgi:hypothetical protein